MMEPIVRVERTEKLDPKLAKKIYDLDHACFGIRPIVQKYSWAKPEWTVHVKQGGELVSSLKIVKRKGQFGQKKVEIGGINNVLTITEWQGHGFSSLAMRKAGEFMFGELKCNYGLLLCATELIPFYERFGWKRFGGVLYFDQPSGRTRWDAETMILPNGEDNGQPNEIDLCGLPW